MKLKQYPDYKKVELPWIEKIPLDWCILRAKCIFRQIDVRSETGDEELLSVSERKGVTPRKNVNVTMFKAESYKGYKLCWPGDLVINSLWAWMQGLGVSEYHGIISTAYGVYRIKKEYKVDNKYFNYLFRSTAYLWELRVRSKGIWRSRYQLTDDAFMTMPVINPPENAQRQIVKYLDAKCAQITKFIRNKRRLIQLLKEQKQAIINQAVTQGIDTKVKMKPSGVDWVGDIPEHWELKRLRTMSHVMPSGVDKHIVEGEIPIKLCNYVDVYKNDRILDSIDFMKGTATSDEIKKYKLRGGDVLITKDSESWDDIAVPSFVPEKIDGVICAYHLAIVRAYGIDGEYLFWAFLSEKVADQFRVSAKGVTRYGLAQGAIKGAWFPVPPKKEQLAIVKHINQFLSKNYLAIEKLEQEIKLIQEYCTRLISDVVTGKVDVRNIKVEDVADDDLEDALSSDEEIEETEDSLEEVFDDN
ncbi:MAG: restriction endonuclease subunit S [Candidatus Aceula meridiana]|nr:restriction endonuclease subunit S [Candidatus Aceula meridiana]